MKLLVDNKIPFFREYLKKIKNHDQFIIKYFDDNNLENNDCLNADALFIRSTTRVNSELLSNSPIKFIGSATSGYDHFDNNILNNSKYPLKKFYLKLIFVSLINFHRISVWYQNLNYFQYFYLF